MPILILGKLVVHKRISSKISYGGFLPRSWQMLNWYIKIGVLEDYGNCTKKDNHGQKDNFENYEYSVSTNWHNETLSRRLEDVECQILIF